MQIWKYVALGPGGRRVTGEITAQSMEEAENLLSARSLFPTKIAPSKQVDETISKPSSSLFAKRVKKPKVDDVCEMLRAMAVMVGAGVPLVESLTALAENAAHPGIQEVARIMKVDMMAGKSISQALFVHPDVFPQVVCDMISVSDDAGRLHETLNSAIEYMDKTNTVRKNVISSLTYPGILMGASGVAFLVLIVVILPTFNEAFSSMGVKLPWFTTMLLNIGIFIKSRILFVIFGTIGLVMGWKRLMKIPAFNNQFLLILSRVPVLGSIIMGLSLNRSLRTLGSLLRTGIPIIEGLSYASRVAGHPIYAAAYDQVKIAIGNGATLSDAMANTKRFPKMVIQMVAVGERSGKMSELISVVTEHGEAEIDRKVKSAVSLLEPAVIIGMGIVVGMITISILMPMFQMNNQIK